MDPQPDPVARTGLARWPYAVLAYVCVALAMIGVVLPGIPTVPFLLLAGWAASRGSKRVHDWLHDHPRFGPSLRAWRDERAVPTRAKVTAVLLLVASWLFFLWRVGDPVWLATLAALFLTVSIFLLTRPAPSAELESE
ncbi:MAG: YbaN family protein [Gemmatimonadota bacterium]|jgi:uncharacterized membrane protein YbaN (DUF454 family)